MSIAASGAQPHREVRAVVVGHICVDHNVVDGMPQPESWGSAVLFARQFFAHVSGIATDAIAPYGRDFASRWPTIAIANAPSGERTLLYENVTVHGSTTRRSLHDENTTPVPLDECLRSAVAAADFLMVAPLLPNYSPAYIGELHSALAPTASSVLLGQGYLRRVGENGSIERRSFDESSDVLPYFDVLIVSDEDIAETWDDASAEATRWSIEHPSLDVIVTRNAMGAALFENGEQSDFPISPLEPEAVTAPVGAGDTFGAAVALSYATDGNIRMAIESGHAAAREFLVQVDSFQVRMS